MASEIGKAFIPVEIAADGLDGQLNKLAAGLEGRFGAIGKVSSLALKAGLVAGVAVAAVSVGKYLYDIGAQFDELADTISVKTGKSGKDLDALVGVAKSVGTKVPVSFKDAGTAVAELASRTGLTGTALQKLATQELQLAKVTGGDLTDTIKSSTRLFGDWGLSGAKAGEGLDKLFRASQATGTPVQRLSELLVKFGGPLRQLGFGLDESTALFAKFEQEGVNTELVMGSLRIALGKIATSQGKLPELQAKATKAQADYTQAVKEHGKSSVEASLAEDKLGKAQAAVADSVKAANLPKYLRDQIQAIKDTKNPAEATGLALKLFGARAGPDMAAAIREGRFSVDELVKTISGGKGTIGEAEKGTRDFSEQWLIFKNKVAVVLAPLAEKLFSALGQGMAYVNENAGPLIKQLREDLAPTFEQLGEIVDRLGPVFEFVFAQIENTIKTFVGVAKGELQFVQGVIQAVAALLRGDWAGAWDGAKTAVQGLVTAVTAILNGMLTSIRNIAGLVLPAGKALGQALLDGIVAGIKALPGTIVALVKLEIAAVAGLTNLASAGALKLGAALVSGVKAGLRALPGAAVALVKLEIAAVAALAGIALPAATKLGAAIVTGVVQGMSGLAAGVAGKLTALGGQIRGWAGSAFAYAFQIGTQIVEGVIGGLASLPGRVAGAIGGGIKAGISAAGGLLHGSGDFQFTKHAVGEPLAAGVIEGLVVGLQPLGDKLGESLSAAIDRGRQAIDGARGTFGESFSGLSSTILSAYDGMSAQVLTKSEKLLAALDLSKKINEMRAAIADARSDLDAAKTAAASISQGDGESDADFQARVAAAKAAVLAAQADVDAALYTQKVFNLQRQAEQERVDLDARLALRRQHLADELEALQKSLARRGASEEESQAAIIKLLRKYKIDYRQVGDTLGGAFVTGMREQLNQALEDAERIAKQIKAALAGAHEAAQNVVKKSSGGAAPVQPPGVLAAAAGGPLAAGAATGGAAGLAGPSSLTAGLTSSLRSIPAAIAGSSTVRAAQQQLGGLQIRVFIGDEELRGIVRTEVRSSEDTLAHSLLAARAA